MNKRVIKGLNDLSVYGELTTPGSQRMINHLRWSAMEVLNQDFREQIKKGRPAYTEKTIPRDYWIEKTKEIAFEEIFKKFPDQGPPESLYVFDTDTVINSIEETIKIYGKMPYIDEPEWRKKSNTFFVITCLIIIIGIGFLGNHVFQKTFTNQKVHPTIQK